MAGDDEPKPLVFPMKPVGNSEPKALVFPTKPADEEGPRPLDFSQMQRARTMPMEKDATPKALSFGNVPSTPPKTTGRSEAGTPPRALNFPASRRAEAIDHMNQLIERISPSNGTAGMRGESGSTLDLHQVGQPTRQVHVPAALSFQANQAPRRPEGPSNKVIGGDPRAPAMMAAAQAKDPALANDPRFRGRLEMFLKQSPSEWITWGEKEMRALTDQAQRHRDNTTKLSTANAVQWAQECEHSYSRPPSFLDRFARSKPEFYRVRLEQARDILQKLDAEVNRQIEDMQPRLETLRLDTLVLEVATTALTIQNQQIIAGQRLGSLVQGQQTIMMIMQSARDLANTITTQAAAVNDRLNVTIPQWLLAMSKA